MAVALLLGGVHDAGRMALMADMNLYMGSIFFEILIKVCSTVRGRTLQNRERSRPDAGIQVLLRILLN